MKKCQIYQAGFMAALYGELEAKELAAFNQHLAECDSCRVAFDEMRSTLAVLSKNERPEPEPAYWNGYWSRLEKRLERKHQPILEKFTALITWLSRLPGWSYQLAGAAAILWLGIYIGYLAFRPPAPPEKKLVAQSTRDLQLNLTGQEAADYLERSKILLLGIVNLDPTAKKIPLDFVRQQQVSRELLTATADLKQQIQGTKHQRLQVLLADLELILMQIANLEQELDAPAIELISRGVNEQSILLKINLEEMLLNERRPRIQDKTIL